MDKYKKLVSFQYIDDDEELDKAQRKKWRGKIKEMDKTLFRLLDLSRDMSERIVELKDNVDRQERAARKRKKYKRHAIRDF